MSSWQAFIAGVGVGIGLMVVLAAVAIIVAFFKADQDGASDR